MANHLHWYINGTAGAKDGTEVDVKNILNLGAINTFSLMMGSGTSTGGYYPPVIMPLYFRCESGFEISEGTLKIGFRDMNNGNFIGALGNRYSYDQCAPLMFKTIQEINTALLRDYIGISRMGNGNALTITEENKITDVNSAVILIFLIHDATKIGSAFPMDLINFSFTETAVTA